MGTQILNVPPIQLDWSGWEDWNDLMEDARSGGDSYT